jgi:glycosyltransferase involved in cell wall biosynthesis
MLLQFPPVDPGRKFISLSSRPCLLMVLYDCMPAQGSEASLGWMRVMEAAREFEVHAVVGPESFDFIQRYVQAHRLPASVHFHAASEDWLRRGLQRVVRQGARGSWAYRRWQWLAFLKAQELHRVYDFSLAHHVNLAEFSEPGYIARLGIPYIWGPASGTELLPDEFMAGLSLRDQIAERARQIRIRMSLRSRRVRHAGSKASVVLATNSSARRDFERVFRRPVELLPESGIQAVRRPDLGRFRSQGPLNLLWAADLTRPNGLTLLLEAVANLGHDVDYHLRIIGTGPLESEWKNLATEMGVRRRCTFLGDVGAAGLTAQLEWGHLFVFTGLHNTPVAPMLEALAHGVPVMCLDHHGAHDIVTPACGIRIAVTHPGQAVANMASSIRSLAQDRTPLLQLSAGACDRAQNYLWRENTARLMGIYRGLARIAHRNAS